MKDENATDRIGRHVALWWKHERAQKGLLSSASAFARILWEFAVESLPERRKQRYGDAEYDWDFRVNTTGGSVRGRDRFLGLLHSPYMPTEPALFREILDKLLSVAPIDLRDFVFIDLGSGKGRTLLMASDYPFREIVGVELLPSLHQSAQENIAAYKSENQKCFALESTCGDAGEFAFPDGPLVLYLFNPLPESGLVRVLQNLQASLEKNPRDAFVLYHNPLLEKHLNDRSWLQKLAGTQQFAIYQFRFQATFAAT
ncbi:MAG TPA: class I SAM-dependent methyltransferase [Terriglobales bacterium]